MHRLRRVFPPTTSLKPIGAMKKLLLPLLISLGTCLFGPTALAQAFPRGPITIVVPVAAGDGFDSAARILAEDLTKELRTPVVVENKPGAGGSLAVADVLRAPKDGHRLLMAVNSSLTFRPVLEPASTTYDPFKDLTPLSLAERTPSVLVIGNNLPFTDVKEMVAYAKKNPGKVRVGTAGQGSIGDFGVEIVNSVTDAGLVSVPFKGSTPAILAMRGGHIEAVVVSLGSVSGALTGGSAKAIAMSHKFPGFESVPTLKELGYAQDLIGVWTAFFVPAGVPEAPARALTAALAKTLQDPAIAARILPLGITNEFQPAARLTALMREEHATVQTISKRIGLVK